MKEIEITEQEIEQARDFAFNLIRAGKRGSFENYFIGTLGEIAYGKHTNQKVNFDVYERGKGDGGADFKGIQVKTTKWTGPDKQLKVGTYDSTFNNPTVLKLVLARATITNPSRVELIGEVTKANFIKKADYDDERDYSKLNESKLDLLF